MLNRILKLAMPVMVAAGIATATGALAQSANPEVQGRSRILKLEDLAPNDRIRQVVAELQASHKEVKSTAIVSIKALKAAKEQFDANPTLVNEFKLYRVNAEVISVQDRVLERYGEALLAYAAQLGEIRTGMNETRDEWKAQANEAITRIDSSSGTVIESRKRLDELADQMQYLLNQDGELDPDVDWAVIHLYQALNHEQFNVEAATAETKVIESNLGTLEFAYEGLHKYQSKMLAGADLISGKRKHLADAAARQARSIQRKGPLAVWSAAFKPLREFNFEDFSGPTPKIGPVDLMSGIELFGVPKSKAKDLLKSFGTKNNNTKPSKEIAHHDDQ